MSSHATVSLAEGQILSQVTHRDINELTDAVDAIDQVSDLLGVIFSLNEAADTTGNLETNVNSVIQAAREKLDEIRELLKAWPSSGMVAIDQP
jgi:hypothetical protein